MTNINGFIDADGHIVESDAEILQFLPEPFKDREDLLSFPFFPTLDGFHRQARRVADGKGRYIVKGSLKEWQRVLDEDQIAWSVLYPTAGLTFGLVRDKDWACALATGYNKYLYETFTKSEKRLKGMALIPLQSVSDAVNELTRAINELGFVGAVLPAVGLRQPLGDERYFPVYEAAQKLGALLVVHAAPTQGIGLDSFDRLIEVRALSHGFAQMIQMTSMIYQGVFDRFPKLNLAYAEAGCGWVPYLMERLDLEYEHRNTQVPECKKSPSDHLKSGRIFIHCELEDRGIAHMADLFRDDILFCATDFPTNRVQSFVKMSGNSWHGRISARRPNTKCVSRIQNGCIHWFSVDEATDYNHSDSKFSHTVAEVMEGKDLSDALKTKIMGENAAKLYDL